MNQSPWREKTLQQQLQDSPSRTKIRVLSERWNNIQQGLDKDKYEKKELLEMQIAQIEQLINQEKPRDENRFKTLKEHYLKVQDSIYHDRLEREKYDGKKQQDAKSLEENLMSQLEEEKNHKRKLDLQLLKQIEDRFVQLNENLQSSNQQYQEKTNKKITEVQGQVADVRYALDYESSQRDESQNNLVGQIDTQIRKFQEMMLIEKQVREETQKKIYNMIEDIHTRIQSEIQRERSEREVTTDSLLKLLEETCLKIEDNFRK